MFRKILVPLDGSENAEKSLPWIVQYARPRKAQVVLLYVFPWEAEVGWYPISPPAEDVKKALLRVERALNLKNIPAKMMLGRGSASSEISKAAQDQKCDLIVMTTRGGSRVSRWLMGGVTEQVMRLSKVPVLVVRSRTRRPAKGRIGKILVPVDGSKRSERVIPAAVHLARLHRARLTFLHVITVKNLPPRAALFAAGFERAYKRFETRIVSQCTELRKRGIKSDFVARHGDAAVEILKEARKVDLVAMATHGFGGIKRLILGSVAEKVIHETDRPVFVFKGNGLKRAVRKSSVS